MDRNLALEFVRVTEAAAIACSKWMGKGDKISADKAAVDAMRSRFNSVDFDGEVVIGEGEKDEAPLLFIGEEIGTKKGIKVDIAVDPLECTSNLAKGKPNAISVLAAAPKGCLLKAPGTYMDQLCVGPQAKGVIDIKTDVKTNLTNVAKALDKEIGEVTVILLDRPRHEQLVKDIRDAGAKIRLIGHGTVSAGVAAALPDSGIDVMMGIGGAPEAVITAAALKSLGGDMQGILKPHDDKCIKQAEEMGISAEKVFGLEDLAKGDEVMFVATGISDGPLLKGIVVGCDDITTHSIVMRAKTGTIRHVEAKHRC
ncbi:MAG: class II fructose-bisphosphatase [Candidatus Woesearchaeota archaeon]|jgi:fructose-1,6-bisphosphatase II|nr:class II fructose-bisphosphatase [Candidatus Woesearchaeota archaeon]